MYGYVGPRKKGNTRIKSGTGEWFWLHHLLSSPNCIFLRKLDELLYCECSCENSLLKNVEYHSIRIPRGFNCIIHKRCISSQPYNENHQPIPNQWREKNSFAYRIITSVEIEEPQFKILQPQLSLYLVFLLLPPLILPARPLFLLIKFMLIISCIPHLRKGA